MGLLGFFALRSCRGGDAGSASDQTTKAASMEQAVVEEPDYTDINLLMVGDILFHYQVRQSGLQSDGSRNYDHIYAHFKSELEDKDIKGTYRSDREFVKGDWYKTFRKNYKELKKIEDIMK